MFKRTTARLAGRNASASKPIRVSEETHASLGRLAAETGLSMQEIADFAVEELRRKRLLQAANEAFAALRADKEAWADAEMERSDWDATLSDGLD